jgi:UDP-glucose 4-epimerase
VKKILITGNSGYIGSHLTKLLTKDYDVYGLDIVPAQVKVTQHLLSDIRHLDHLFTQVFDTVIHLAAVVRIGESEQDPIKYYDTNLIGTINVLKKLKFKNFIFSSTGAAEHCYSPYGVSKRAAEDCVKQICSTPYTIFRFYNVIGSDGIAPTNPDGLMYNLIRSKDTGMFTIFGNDYNTPDGTCVRDYVHVNEICQAIQKAIEKPSMSVERLGHGVGHTVEEMVKIFKTVNNISVNINYGPRRPGDLESSVLKETSSYMTNLYTINELLKI